MSTTFDIVPVKTKEITFNQVLNKSQERINHYLKSVEIKYRIELNITIRANDESYIREFKDDEIFAWNNEEYAWFTIKNIPGGTDAYYCDLKEEETGDWEYVLEHILELNQGRQKIDFIDEKINKAKEICNYWHFRCSVGQTRIISLSYGLIAGVIAELTDGIIWSPDAWGYGYDIAPCESKLFFEHYCILENAENEHLKEQIKENIVLLEKELEKYLKDVK